MLDTLVLAPDGRFLAYAGSTKDGWYFHRGDAKEGPYMDVYSASLLPDGKTAICFAVDRSDRAFAVVDGVASESFDNKGLFSDVTSFHAPQ